MQCVPFYNKNEKGECCILYSLVAISFARHAAACPARLARVVYLVQEEKVARLPGDPFGSVLDWTDNRFTKRCPGFGAWYAASRESLEQLHPPLKFPADGFKPRPKQPPKRPRRRRRA